MQMSNQIQLSMLSYAKSDTARTGDRLNGFENGKTQLFNLGSWKISLYFLECSFKHSKQRNRVSLYCSVINIFKSVFFSMNEWMRHLYSTFLCTNVHTKSFTIKSGGQIIIVLFNCDSQCFQRLYVVVHSHVPLILCLSFKNLFTYNHSL